MKKVSKLIASLLLGVSVVAFSPVVEAHAEWKHDNVGWWWKNDGAFYGLYAKNTWKLINYEWYYFGQDGYMLHDTITPDGYQVGSDGAWITNAPPQLTSNNYNGDLTQGVILSKNSLTLSKGETAKNLLVRVNTSYTASNVPHVPPTVLWSTSNPNVVTVKGGEITAVGNGTATITCSTNDSSIKSATCTVTVR